MIAESNSEGRDSIRQFVDSYWKLPFKLRLNDSLEEQEAKHEEHLRRKYSPRILDEYARLAERNARHRNEQTYLELVDFVFKTGLCDDIDPYTVLRSRNTLRSLLTYLATEDKPFVVADLGSGNGRIAVGLASYLDSLKELYAIDISPSAFTRMNGNIAALSENEQKRVRRKIRSLPGNYLTDDLQRKFFQHAPDGADVTLAAYPYYSFERILPVVLKFTKPHGKIIACYEQDLSGINAVPHPTVIIADTLEMVKEGQNKMAHDYGLRFDIIDHFELLPWEMMAVISVGKRAAQKFI